MSAIDCLNPWLRLWDHDPNRSNRQVPLSMLERKIMLRCCGDNLESGGGQRLIIGKTKGLQAEEVLKWQIQ